MPLSCSLKPSKKTLRWRGGEGETLKGKRCRELCAPHFNVQRSFESPLSNNSGKKQLQREPCACDNIYPRTVINVERHMNPSAGCSVHLHGNRFYELLKHNQRLPAAATDHTDNSKEFVCSAGPSMSHILTVVNIKILVIKALR